MKSDRIDQPTRWYNVILLWELLRLPYNMTMILAGLLSLSIAYVSIPLVYEIIGLLLNCFFTLGWIVELLLGESLYSSRQRLKYRIYFFAGYWVVSVVLVLGFAFWLRTR